MLPVLLDTDILSAIMRQNPDVLTHAGRYLMEHGLFTISVITKYEIARGLEARHADKQRHAFEKFCVRTAILPVDDDVARRGASIYADLASRGALIGDADILISATALVHQMGVVTRNRKHFDRIAGLHTESWLD